AQLAGSLAREDFLVLRYDKRGVGQSGGRSERATLQDYADDLMAAVKWLAKRQDVDPRRIAVVGHSEGVAVALLAVREQADSTWFRSLLLFDPAKVMPKVKQPMLIVQGDLDMQVPAHHADTLAKLARARKK